MADKSTIEWTDATWPIVQGCDPVSQGCVGCYAVPLLWRMMHNPDPKISGPLRGVVEKHVNAGGETILRFTGKLALREDRLDWPLKWRQPRMIFVPSHGDIFHKDVPDSFLDKIFAVMGACDDQGLGHQFQVLTKRAKRQHDYMNSDRAYKAWNSRRLATEAWPPRNIWCGVSAEDQPNADERIPLLLQTPAAVRFVSLEPLLGPIDLSPYIGDNPVHEMQTERGVRLPSGNERGSGDNAGRHDLEGSEARMGSLEKEGGQPPVQEGTGGARLRGVSPSPNHDRRSENLRFGSSSSLSALQRADTDRPDRKSYLREEEEKRPDFSRTSHALGAADSRYSRSKGRAYGSERNQERDGQIDLNSGEKNTPPSATWGEAIINSSGFRGQLSGDFEDRKGRSMGKISWCIVGGESGSKARPMHPDWARGLRDQCKAAGIAFFYKQWGAWEPLLNETRDWGRDWFIIDRDGDVDLPDGRMPVYEEGEYAARRVGKKVAGRLLDGREWNEFPIK